MSNLLDLSKRLRSLPRVPEMIAPRCAEEATKRMRTAYNGQKDPYGVPWAPKAATNRDGGKLLVESGAMKAGTKGVAEGTRIDLVVGHPEAAEHHLKGHPPWLPRRRPTLDRARGLPRYWLMSFDRFAKRAVRSLLGIGGGR